MSFKNIDIHKFWRNKSFLNYLLLPLSFLWCLGSQLRKLTIRVYKSNLFIICLGNINLGGAGKTPSAILLAKKLTDLGYKVAFLSKGYGGSLKEATWVDKNNHNASEVGDEPLILAKHFPTLVSKDRVKGLQLLEKYGFHIIIIDDGYQNPSFKKDFNILIVNGDYGFGNKNIFPSGPLRESISSGFKKSNYLIMLESKNEEVESLAKKYNVNITEGRYQVSDTTKLKKGSKVLAFCGIGIPEKFKKTLKNNGIEVEEFIFYKDHYLYSKKDIEYLISKAKKKSLKIVTTEKDYIKIPFQYKDDILSYDIDLVLDNQEELLDTIIKEYNKKG